MQVENLQKVEGKSAVVQFVCEPGGWYSPVTNIRSDETPVLPEKFRTLHDQQCQGGQHIIAANVVHPTAF